MIFLLAAAIAAVVWIAFSMESSAVSIADYARKAGFTGEELITAVAIALAESNGNAMAYNPEKEAGAPEGKGSYGLWQIYLHAHPEFENWDLYNPEVNAHAAYSIFVAAGRSFKPWSTWKNRSYLAHLGSAASEVNA